MGKDTVQMDFFASDTQLNEQIRMLKLLLSLKSKEIEEAEFKYFFGTTEEIRIKRIEVDKKIDHFKMKITNAFPNIPL
ncbi:hypothetical protein MZM54_03830 [[Brevibacterium] frigoritolerans]|nr:hypothetical protein [Peribacillus frigoritolerans]